MPRVKYNEHGEEIPDSQRPELPLGFKKPESLAEQVRRLIRSEHVRQAAMASGHETFEEADDFEVGDDYDPRSPYEEVFDPTLNEAPEVKEVVSRRAKKAEATPPKAKKAKAQKAPEAVAEGSGESEGDAPSEE